MPASTSLAYAESLIAFLKRADSAAHPRDADRMLLSSARMIRPGPKTKGPVLSIVSISNWACPMDFTLITLGLSFRS